MCALPIFPTGRTFETVTTGEGGITAGSFYTAFFAAVEHNLASTAAAPAGTAPAPAARVAAERPASAAPADSAPATDK